MVAFLTFLQGYELVGNYILGLIALWYFSRFLITQVRLSRTSFGLERELLQGQRNGATGRFLLAILAGIGIYLAVQYGLPEAKRVEQIQAEANAVNLPTITPTPTPLELFGVDVCTNPNAQLVQPKPGEQVTGKVTILIVANIPNFAFYKIELGRPDEPDVWVTLFNDNQVAVPDEPFSWIWDSTTVSPGVYHLRLTVMAADLSYPLPCVVPIQVLEPSL